MNSHPASVVLLSLANGYMIENQKETPQEKPKSTPTVIVIAAHSTSFPLDQRPPAVGGGMEHEEQKDPVAQSNSF